MKKTYIGTKTVKAEPMSAECANSMGYRVPTTLMGTMGYEVEYEDGYKSWSPKDVLEKHYKVAETHIDRMKIEHADLTARLAKLDKALDCTADEGIKKFGVKQYSLMIVQHEFMTHYADVLEARIQLALANENTSK
jgi:hypothetical protein